MKHITLFLLIVGALAACTPQNNSHNLSADGDSMTLKYATGFAINYTDNYKTVVVFNPWQQGKIMARYYLVTSDTCQIPTDGVRVQIPLQRMAATSCTHIGFLDMLGDLPSVKGVCSPQLIYNAAITQSLSEGKITDLGDALNLNLEKTMQMQPQAVMMSGYGNNDAYTERMARVGIPVVMNMEWMETSMLARAEWIKFVAAFYNQEQQADSLFSEMEKHYSALCLWADSIAKVSIAPRPTIMTGGNFRGTWYMPSGKGYMGKLFMDAGADYFYKNDTTDGSLPLNIETVLQNFSDADVWIGSSAGSLQELKNMDGKHTLFKAYKTGQVYNFNKRKTESGANDFWEMGVVRPDLVLADMLKILYPNYRQNYEFVFVSKLE